MGCLYSKDFCFRRAGEEEHESLKIKPGEDGKSLPHAGRSPETTSLHDDGEDQLHHQMVAGRDSDAGINRLNRVSSQFLPPEGSRTVKVAAGNYELRYSYLSQRGYYPDALDKPNQDSYCIHTPFGTSLDHHFFGVFDGHGEFGAQCSQFVNRKLCENLLINSRFQTDPVEALHAAYLLTNSQLHLDDLDDSMSGTTAVTILVRGTTIYVANTGDSRAVIAEKRGMDLVAVDLSIDQTPFRTDELERVKLCGARVLTLDQIEGLKNPDIQYWGTEGEDGDPPRVWVQNDMYPGTAFTRSIGDMIAESIGVVANPEVVALNLTVKNPFFVIASDGVFEFLSSQTVVDMVSNFKDPQDACAAVVAESYRRWLQFETRTDDITVIVVHINGLPDTEHVHSGAAISTLPLLQIAETTGSEPPSMAPWYKKNHRIRQDVSRARLRAIESSLESGAVWVPPSPTHRKTWEEEAHIERALRDHFLFRRLTDSQSQVLLDCMQRVEVKPGDVVVQQGGEGDCFYVVGSGEFEVLATQVEDDGKEITKVLHRNTAEKLSSFGELALMYNKPLQASVRAVTVGTLWALKREDFRGILTSEFFNLSSLKLLRSVNILSRLTILQLSRVFDSLSEVSFAHGGTIINKNDIISALYIIQKGQVRLTYNADFIGNPHLSSLSSSAIEYGHSQDSNERELELSEGSSFGEWALLGEQIPSICAVALSSVTCTVITKEKFDSAVGMLSKLQQDDRKSKDSLAPPSGGQAIKDDAYRFTNIELSDLEWKMVLYSTDCSETGIVLPKGSEKLRTLKRYSKRKVKQLGKEAQVLKERDLFKSLSPSSCVPQVLHTCSDKFHVGILLSTCLACPLASILTSPLDESSAQFCAASIVIALEELHKNSVLYRGVSPDILMLDRCGHLQLIDFRFAKKLAKGRTFTVCGVADFLAPEIIQGKGHGFAADWWALGVLIYFMLQLESPFGSWRESEVETVGKIAKGQFTLPHTFSTDVVDLITKLLKVDEDTRLGSSGADPIKSHVWFERVDWKGISDQTIPVPEQIASRVDMYLGNCTERIGILTSPPSEGPSGLDSDWFDD